MHRLLFDTDVIIDFLKGNQAAKDFLFKHKNFPFFLSTISVAELFVGVRNDKEIDALNSLLFSFNAIVVSKEIAKKGGLIKQKYGKSHGVGLADAIIAATVEESNSHFVTLNKKHFPMIKNIITPYFKH